MINILYVLFQIVSISQITSGTQRSYTFGEDVKTLAEHRGATSLN